MGGVLVVKREVGSSNLPLPLFFVLFFSQVLLGGAAVIHQFEAQSSEREHRSGQPKHSSSIRPIRSSSQTRPAFQAQTE